MIRKIIKIEPDACNGCGLCVSACHEGAIQLVDGKATLMRDDYCDGLGNCLPVCPTGAISFEEREAAAFDEQAVEKQTHQNQADPLPCGCPGTQSKTIQKHVVQNSVQNTAPIASQLGQWPVQLKLVPVNAPYFHNAKLLIAADCTAFAYGDFHSRLIRDKITLIGCPKLDEINYADKLTEILKHNEIQSLTVVRMEVPCCKGIADAVVCALRQSGKIIPWEIVTISTDGRILEN